jgi:hypothetical protein
MCRLDALVDCQRSSEMTAGSKCHRPGMYRRAGNL